MTATATATALQDPLLQDRKARGRPLTRVEVDEWLADRQTSTNNGYANVAAEIAAQLRGEVRDLELLHRGTFTERLEALGNELADSDDPSAQMAALHVRMAVLVMAP